MVEILNPPNVLACLTQDAMKANLDGVPIMKLGFYTGSSATYQEVTSWTISTGKKGVLGEVSFCSDLPDTARFKVTVGASTVLDNIRLTQDVTLPFPKGATVSTGTKLTVYVKSDGATTIKANASITGKEV